MNKQLGMSAANTQDYKTYFPIFGEPKIDGRRLFVKVLDGKSTALTHSGLDVTSKLPTICDWLSSVVQEGVFDGELTTILKKGDIYGSPWAKTGMLFGKNTSSQADHELVFVVFDFVNLSIFKKPYYEDNTPCSERYARLKELLLPILQKTSKVALLEGQLLHNAAEVNTYYMQSLERGYEGIMLKDPNGSYDNYRRTGKWLKMKPTKTEEFPIVAFEPGQGKNKNRLGKIVVEVDGRLLHVGGGFLDKPSKDQWEFYKLAGTAEEFSTLNVSELCDRETIWKFRELLKGCYVEVKSQDDQAPVSIRRCPIFVRFRVDKI